MAKFTFQGLRAKYSDENPYAVLGLQEGCALQEVKAAYKSHALQVHPDKPSDDLSVEQQTELFQLLGTAYDKIRTGSLCAGVLYGDLAGEHTAAAFSPQQTHDRNAGTKETLRVARQHALHAKWTKELQFLERQEVIAVKTERQSGKVAARLAKEVAQAEARAKRIVKESRAKRVGKDPRAKLWPEKAQAQAKASPKLANAHDAPKLDRRERNSGKPEKQRTDWAADQRIAAREAKRSENKGLLTNDDFIKSGLGLDRRAENLRSVDATAEKLVPRSQRFRSTVSDPLEAHKIIRGQNGKRSLNATIPTTEDWETHQESESLELREQWAATDIVKAHKQECQRVEAAQVSTGQHAKRLEKSRNRMAFLKEQLKAVGPLHSESMDSRTRKAVLSGRGNTVESLPSGQEQRQAAWEANWRQMLIEEALLTSSDLSNISGDVPDFCLAGNTDRAKELNLIGPSCFECNDDGHVIAVNGSRIPTVDMAAMAVAEYKEAHVYWDESLRGWVIPPGINPLLALASLRDPDCMQMSWAWERFELMLEEGFVNGRYPGQTHSDEPPRTMTALRVKGKESKRTAGPPDTMCYKEDFPRLPAATAGTLGSQMLL